MWAHRGYVVRKAFPLIPRTPAQVGASQAQKLAPSVAQPRRITATASRPTGGGTSHSPQGLPLPEPAEAPSGVQLCHCRSRESSQCSGQRRMSQPRVSSATRSATDSVAGRSNCAARTGQDHAGTAAGDGRRRLDRHCSTAPVFTEPGQCPDLPAVNLLHAAVQLVGQVAAGQVDVGKGGVRRAVTGESGDRVQLPPHARQVGQAQVPGGVGGELRQIGRQRQPSDQTFDHVHRLSGAALFRRDSDKNNGPRARESVARWAR